MDGAFPDMDAAKTRARERQWDIAEPRDIPPIRTAAEFMAGYVAPEYIVDGILQRGRLYALTSPTGHGKTAVALYVACYINAGRDIGNIEVARGNVIFLEGENPDDLRCRVYAAEQFYGISPDEMPHFLPGNFPIAADDAERLKQEIDKLNCEPVLIVVDTAAAYFDGDDDNHNVQMGAYARNLRVLTGCKGNPAVLVLAHPVKNPDRDNLLPRGGGAFLNELDANLTLWSESMSENTILHWQGKIRGPDFAPVSFALTQVKIDKLKDSKGRPIVSIVATLQTDHEAEQAAARVRSDQDIVLELLRRTPGMSQRAIAEQAGWVGETGVANKAKVNRLVKTLKAEKLVTAVRGKLKVTDAGKRELEAE